MAQGMKMKNLKTNLILFGIPVIIFCVTFIVLFSLGRTQPLVHDEAVYLTKARSWQEGTPADQFMIYRPIGMAIFGRIMLQFGDSEQIVRIFGVFFGAVTMVFIYLLFQKMFSKLVALIIVLVVSSSTLFLENSPQFLNDIPSSGLLFGCLWVVWDWYITKCNSRLIYLFALFSAVAFYLRYGVSSTLVIIFVFSFFILGKKLLNDKNLKYERIFDTLILSFILFLPHFIESSIRTKDFLGILKRSGDAAGREYIGEGLVAYIKWLPSEMGGYLLGCSVIFGIIVVSIILCKKKLREKHIEFVWLGSVGLVSFVLTGLLVHAEARYVFFSMVIFSGLGIAGLFLVFSRFNFFKFILSALCLISVIIFGYKHYNESILFFKDKALGTPRTSYVKASLAIKEDTKNEKGCVIWSASVRPELSWYTKCHTLNVYNRDTFKKDFLINLKRSHYSVVFSRLGNVQLDENKAKEFNLSIKEIFRTKASESDGDIIVYKIDDQDRMRFESAVEKE